MSNSNDVLYKIKPLIWSEEDVKEEFDRVTAPTSFGPYWVGLSGDMQWEWGYYFCEWSDEDEIECEGLEDGKRRRRAALAETSIRRAGGSRGRLSVKAVTPIMRTICAARSRRGLSQEGLASRCGIAASAISHYETGRRRPDLQNLVKLADGLGVSIDYLLGRTVNDKSHLVDVDRRLEKVRLVMQNAASAIDRLV